MISAAPVAPFGAGITQPVLQIEHRIPAVLE
jgi:hypothetical protein